MDKIRCNRIEVVAIEFTRKLDFEGIEKEIPVRLQAEYADNKNPNEKSARLMLKLQIAEKKSEAPFYCRLKVAGYFEWKDLKADEAKKRIEKEGAEIIFSFMRTYVYDLMQNSGIDPFVLPIEHFD